ncbi:unnamed protein product, partial [Heterotrigona itama]
MCAQKIESFDVSAKQREILQFKHLRKIQLRQQYLKEVLNPTIDDATQRLALLRAQHEFVGQTKFWPHMVLGIAYIGTIFLCGRLLKYLK